MSHKKKRKRALANLPSDEVAFVRALIAEPTDATARLVFADWLDERADPRAAWLRDDALWAHLDAGAVAWLLVPGTDTRLPPAVEAAGVAAVPFVRSWVRQRDTLLRWHQARFFIESNRPAELRPVSELVARLKSESWYDCWEAVIDLEFYGPAAAPAAEALTKVFGRAWPEFEDWEADPLQRAAHTALGAIGPGAAAAVPELAGDVWYSEEAYAALLAIRPDPDLVYRHLCCDEDSFARTGVRLVADLSDDPVGALVRILREMNDSRSEAAAELLGEMGEDAAAAVPAMIEVFERARPSWSDHYLRNLLARAFVSIGEPARIAVPALRAVLAEYANADPKDGYPTSARDAITAALTRLDPPAPRAKENGASA